VRRGWWGLWIGVLLAVPAQGQEPMTENTFRRGPESGAPSAVIADVAWLAGEWRGEGLGGAIDEGWSTPAGGAMVAWFRMAQRGEPVFYELMTIAEENGTLVLKVKHFNPDMSGWEQPEETVDFPLVMVEKDAVHFEGLSYRLTGADSITIHLAMQTGEGEFREERLVMTRVVPGS
jgi:hypothetical protein